ncbi:MAG: AbrB/MazE/SpoVT family DNA-binding domain-containing protein [Myxococcota bacterium]
MDVTDKRARAKIFWTGGSQAVRLPKAMRLEGTEVLVQRKGNTLVLEPIPEGDDWTGFWDRLVPLKHPIKRLPTRPAEKRREV